MIFLAVTMGFIAENLREHFTDRTKGKQYIEGFISNVKDDTASLRHVIAFDSQQVKGPDSMLKLSRTDMSVDSNRKSFYYFVIKYCYSSATFRSNDATLQQLKSTGDYRLIEKDHIADSLTKYERDIRDIYTQGDYYEAYFKEIVSGLDEMGDMTVIGDSSFIKNGKITDRPFPFLRKDNGKLETFFNKLFVFKIITDSYVINDLKPQLENSKSLIMFLNNKYHLQN